MEAFSRKAEEFKKLNCQLLALSTDSKYTHLSWTATEPPLPDKIGPLAIQLLSDHAQVVSRHYGVLQTEGYAQRYID
jgi:peroxiredoxin 1